MEEKWEQKVLSLSLSLLSFDCFESLKVVNVSYPFLLLLQFLSLIFDFSINHFCFITCFFYWFYVLLILMHFFFFNFSAEFFLLLIWLLLFSKLKKRRWIKLTQHYTDSPLNKKGLILLPLCMCWLNIPYCSVYFWSVIVCSFFHVDAVVLFLLGFFKN